MQTGVSVSVLFTDLVGSTELASRLGATEAEDVRRTHFALLREAIAEHHGTEIKNLGDGLMVSFPGVGAALDAAIAMQQGIDRHNRSGGEPLGVRIGVATGDAVEEEGDLFGEPVVQAARLCAAAEGGSILAPEVVRLLAPRGAHEFRPVGDLELKGLPDPVPTVELVWTPAEEAGGASIPLQGRLTVPHLAGFVGRTRERDVLDVARKAAATGERRAVLVAGEAGMGKTRLVTEVANAAHTDGAIVLYGRCDEELAIPFQPWVEALTHYARSAGDDVLAVHDPVRLADVSRLIPELRQRMTGLAPPTETDSATERHLLFTAITSVLADAATAGAGCVLVLDDLHWADRATVQLLRHVVATVDIGSVLVLATYRDTDLGADHPLTEALAVLHREPGVDVVSLDGLDDVEIVAMLESIAGHELEDDGVSLAHMVRDETDGNPFFVGEVLRHLAETGSIAMQEDGRWVAVTDLAEIGLPASVRAVVGQRVRRLGELAHQVLSTAAVVGREFDLEVVVAAARLDEDDVVDALEEAAAAGIVSEVAGQADRFTFNHALVQHTLYDDVGGSRRVRLHHRVAEALESMLGADPGDRVGEVANHWLAATRPADLDKAVDYARRAGDRAMAALAHSEAARWYQVALEAHDQRADPDPRVRCELLIALGGASEADAILGGRDHLLDAARIAQELGATDLLVSALLVQRALTRIGEGDDEMIPFVEEALRHVSDGSSRAVLLAMLTRFVWFQSKEPAYELVNEALETARASGDRAALHRVVGITDFHWQLPDGLAPGYELTSEELEVALELGDPRHIADVARMRFITALELGDVVASRASLEVQASVAERTGLRSVRWGVLNGRSLLELLAGRVDEAEATAEEGLAVGGDDDAMSVYGAHLVSIRWHQGRLGELLELSEQLAVANPGIPAYATVVPWINAMEGNLDRARELLARNRADGFVLPWDNAWFTGMMCFAEAAVLCGDLEEAELRYEQLRPWETYVSANGATCEGPIAHNLAQMAEVLGRPEDAIAHERVSLDIARRIEAPFHIARAQCLLGRLTSDAPLVEEALAIARAHGYGGVEAEAAGVLASLADGG